MKEWLVGWMDGWMDRLVKEMIIFFFFASVLFLDSYVEYMV